MQHRLQLIRYRLNRKVIRMFTSIVSARARLVLLTTVLTAGPIMVSTGAGARGSARFPDVYVKAGQQFYVTATKINKRDVQYYGSGGVSFFSADPGYVFGADASPEYL